MKNRRYYLILITIGFVVSFGMYAVTERTYEYRLYYKTSVEYYPTIFNTLDREYFTVNNKDVYVDPNFESERDTYREVYRVFELQLYTNTENNEIKAANAYFKLLSLPLNKQNLIRVIPVGNFKLMHKASAALILIIFLGVLFKVYIVNRKR